MSNDQGAAKKCTKDDLSGIMIEMYVEEVCPRCTQKCLGKESQTVEMMECYDAEKQKLHGPLLDEEEVETETEMKTKQSAPPKQENHFVRNRGKYSFLAGIAVTIAGLVALGNTKTGKKMEEEYLKDRCGGCKSTAL